MIENDMERFSNAWVSLSETLAGTTPTDGSVKLVFGLLKEFSLHDVLRALTDHARTAKWMPAPCEIIERINPPEPELTPEILAGLARAANSPLGVYVAYKVTHYDMKALTDFQLCKRIETLQPDIDKFIAEFKRGELSPDSQRLMKLRGLFEATSLIAADENTRPSAPALVYDDGPIDPGAKNLIDGVSRGMS